MDGINALTIKFDWKRKLRKRVQTDNSAQGSSSGSQKRNNGKSRQAKYVKSLKENKVTKYEHHKARDAARKRKTYVSIHEMEETEAAIKRRKWAEAKKIQRAKVTSQPESGNQQEPGQKKKAKKIKEITADEKRQYWRENKQKIRSKNKGSHQPQKTPKSSPLKTPKRTSRTTLWRKGKQVSGKLPKSPRTCAAVLNNVLRQLPTETTSELKKVARDLSETEDFLIASSVRRSLSNTNPSSSESNRKKYHTIVSARRIEQKYGFKRKLAKSLGIGGKVRRHKTQMAEVQRKKRKDMVAEETKALVKEFWCSEGISREVPLKKRVKKGMHSNLLECTYVEAYRQLKKSHPEVKIGYTTFVSLKPKHVRHMKATERQVCC